MNNGNLQALLVAFLLVVLGFALAGLYAHLRKPKVKLPVKFNIPLDYWTGYEQAAAAIISGRTIDKPIGETEFNDGVRNALKDYERLAYKIRKDAVSVYVMRQRQREAAQSAKSQHFSNQQGTGSIPPRPSKLSCLNKKDWKGCYACFGSGGKKANPCKVCKGTGKLFK
jgi:hypothetical protein